MTALSTSRTVTSRRSATDLDYVTISEYGLLTTEQGHASLERHSVSPSAFEYICQLSLRWSKSGVPLAQLEGGRTLRVDNYVGVLETPCGLQLEILPKHIRSVSGVESSRKLLLKMLAVLTGVKPRVGEMADIALLRRPLSEWVARQFLEQMDYLVKRGVKFDYREVAEELPYVRGRINLPAQIRQPAGREHKLQVIHDVFLADGPENRLLRSALRRIALSTRDAENWRLARELGARTAEVPESTEIATDFRRWRTGRLLAHYAGIRPWCSLVLGEHMPLAQLGPQRGITMLFPMETLFEQYVTLKLRSRLAPGLQLTSQSSLHSLCWHDNRPMFQLQPDIVVSGHGKRWVLDVKWKLLDAADRISEAEELRERAATKR